MTEIVLEEGAGPISWERPDGTDIPAVADQPGYVSCIIAREVRIEPLDPHLGDCRIGQGKACIPDILGAAGTSGIADMRRECLRLVGILDIIIAGARCRAVAGPIECHCRQVNHSVPGRGR